MVNTLRQKMTVFDFAEMTDFGHSLSSFAWKGMADAHRTNGLFAVDGPAAEARIQPVRGAVSRQPSGAAVLLLGSVSLHGVRAIDVSGEPARHRDVPARAGAEAVPRWPSGVRFAQHAGRRQRDTGLAHLCGLRASPDR